MTIEAVQFINSLNDSYPRATDLLKEGDDHIRMIKRSLKQTFPGFNSAISMTSSKLNAIDGAVTADGGGFSLSSPLTVNASATVRDNLRVGQLNTTGQVFAGGIELTSGTPFIDFHFNNSASDFTARIIADSATRLNVSSDLHVNGQFGVDKGAQFGGSVGATSFSCPGDMTCNVSRVQAIVAQQWIQAQRIQLNQDAATTPQGLHMGWNSPVRSGAGCIKTNRGSGTGGLIFEFLNNAGGREGLSYFEQNGTLRAGGSVYANGDVFAGGAHMGTDGNIYDAPAWGGDLKGWLSTNYLPTGGSGRITNWHWNNNTNIDFTVDGQFSKNIGTRDGSDIKFKENIEDVDSRIGYDAINSIPLKSFKYKDKIGINSDTGEEYKNIGKTFSVGFLAQDVEKIIPEAIDNLSDGKYVHDFPLITNLIAAVQHLSAKVKELEAKIKET